MTKGDNIDTSEPVAAEPAVVPITKVPKQDTTSAKACDLTNSVHSARDYTPINKGSYGVLPTPVTNGHPLVKQDGSTVTLDQNGSVMYHRPCSGPLLGYDDQCVRKQPHLTLPGNIGNQFQSLPYSREMTHVVNNNSSRFGNAPPGRPMSNSSDVPRVFSHRNTPHSNVAHIGRGSTTRAYRPQGTISTFGNQKQAFAPPNTYINRSTGGSSRFMKPDDRNSRADATSELPRGPRSQNKVDPSEKKDEEEVFGFYVRHRSSVNRQDFEIDYENAKFYVIKSYSEDDIHKAIKYSVWSSTPTGNKKLDLAFEDAESKALKSGKKVPIFLFFSVNGSGQFVGLAEMMRTVDYTKDMEFWQIDKWNGFFPLKWHVIKDVPNRDLRHIILENNDNKPVPHSRDTQEIGLKQGLEMLKIFKNHSATTSVLDDFAFYNKRQISAVKERVSKPATLSMDEFKDEKFLAQVAATDEAEKSRGSGSGSASQHASLIHRTRNLSLNGESNQKRFDVKNRRENSRHSAFAP